MTSETTKTEAQATQQRRKRTPFGSFSRRLAIPDVLQNDPDYYYRWINDREDRIARAQAAGYEFVESKALQGQDVGDPDLHNNNSDLNSRVSKRLRDFTIYLMRLPIEYRKEDIALKNKESDNIDESIFGGGADKIQNSYGLDVRYKR